MVQTVLIVLISVIAAVVVGSTVFFVWTLFERLTGKPPVVQSAEEARRGETAQSEPAEPEKG